MKTIQTISTLLAFLIAQIAYSQTDSSNLKKPKVIEGNKMKITVETNIIKDKDKNSKIITETDTIYEDVELTEETGHNGEKIIREKKIITKEFKTERTYEKNKSEWFNFDLGFNFLMNNGGMDMPEAYKDLELANGKGCNFNLRIFEQSIDIVHKHLFLVYGAGIEWNNYRFKNNVDLLKDSSKLSYTISTENDYRKNKLVSAYVTVPLLIKVRFKENKDGDAFVIAAGPQFGYLITSHQKQKWKDNGSHKRKLTGDYNLNEFRVGYSLYFGYKDVMFYAKYYPNSAFKTGQGPNVNTVSAGIAFGGFNSNNTTFQ